jgi:hypothetical protein
MWRAVKAMTVLVMATVLAALGVELVAPLFVVPSPTSGGTLLSVELPPIRIFDGTKPPVLLSPSTPVPAAATGGVALTRGDLWGVFRLDPQIGYVHAENVVSHNGWWQSNSLGARSRTETTRAARPGQPRVLVFGESYAQGSRVPQEDAWPAIVQALEDGVEVVNFAVDGYSMAQSLLRFRQVRRQIEYDSVILMFVPEADPIRDINTLRQLIHPAWDGPLMPRYRLREGTLTLVPPLYEDPLDLYRRNGERLTPELRAHLLMHDRLYLPAMYEPAGVMEESIWVKLLARARWRLHDRGVRKSLTDPDAEALQVSRAIVETMRREALADGASFALVILPIEHHWWEEEVSNRQLETWSQVVAAMCSDGMLCVDLLPGLRRIPAGEVDRAFDHFHFGPKMNSRIAASVRREVLDTLVH